jgi:EAL domain-containing protein (putative c-di-GMP-specific phosphodiesterase class I)
MYYFGSINQTRVASLSFEPAAGFIPEYSVSLRLALTEKNNLINQISEGINKRQFIPYYQLKVDAQTGSVSSVEVLARWKLPDGSIVSPGVFIPVAESAGGLITSLTYSLFEQVANDVNGWCANGFRVGRLAINIAGEVLQHEELYNRLRVMNASLPEQCAGLEVEITENIVLGENTRDINSILGNVRAMGIHVAIDDFGTGYASLQTLIDIPIDVLKIDRSFVLPMTESGSGSEVVSAMISLSKKLNKRCVVEGVETAWQWRQLAELGADELQGFYFYTPAAGAEVERFLEYTPDLKVTA